MTDILEVLIKERDRINRAIAVLQGGSTPATAKKKSTLSAAARKKISIAAKARWAKIKAGKK